jgi:creatinine amidohydrolase
VPGQQALFELRQKYRGKSDLMLLLATYWDQAKPHENPAMNSFQKRMGHACEWETSMMLRLAPHLVGELKQLEDVPFDVPFDPALRAWTTKDRTASGHIGYPRHATAEKGEILFQTFTAGLVNLIERVIAWDGHSWMG